MGQHPKISFKMSVFIHLKGQGVIALWILNEKIWKLDLGSLMIFKDFYKTEFISKFYLQSKLLST